jgi:hypothetical protein
MTIVGDFCRFIKAKFLWLGPFNCFPDLKWLQKDPILANSFRFDQILRNEKYLILIVRDGARNNSRE